MHAWELFLGEQEKAFGKEVVEKWLRPLRVVNFDAGNLHLEAQDSFQLAWIKEQLHHKLQTALVGPTGRRIKVHLKLRENFSGKAQGKTRANEKVFRPTLHLVHDALDPQATLEGFLVSPPNELLIKLIREMVAGKTSANPLFIYGDSGSGKSHLLMAVARELQAQKKNPFYVRAETFTEHVVAAIRSGLMMEFRKAYRHVDALLVDDVHFFARKGATQEELFHTFNALHSNGTQIILSSSSPPHALEGVEPRLISRFEWGILLRLEKMTESETKTWLKKRADQFALPLEASALDFLTDALHAESKPLQAALQALTLRLHLNAQKMGVLTAKVVEELLADFLSKEKQKELNPQKIVTAVAEYYGIKSEDLLGKSQTKEAALPRQIAIYLVRQLLSLSFQKIGLIFSRDHSTVMSSVKLVEKRLKSDDKETLSAKAEISRRLKR